MWTRITIDLPKPLADRIRQLANENMRYVKQEIIWLLQEAVLGPEKSAPAVRVAARVQGRDCELSHADD
jgi:hypothetical protein